MKHEASLNDLLEQIILNNQNIYKVQELVKSLIYVIEDKLNIKPHALIKEVKKEAKKGK
jgi:hypothetical protein